MRNPFSSPLSSAARAAWSLQLSCRAASVIVRGGRTSFSFIAFSRTRGRPYPRLLDHRQTRRVGYRRLIYNFI
jgi:hypothetical protein